MPVESSCPSKEILEQFAVGQSAPAEVEEWAAHVETCGQCLSFLQGFQGQDTVLEAMQKPGNAPAPRPQAVDNLMKELGQWKPGAAPAPDDGPTIDTTQQGAGAPQDFLPAAGAEELGRIGSYRVQKVLGRGGMGVVYQAWDEGLRRPVALKMVRAGAHATAQELARFEAEAQAVARLQHPNIVQVYQVAQHQGRPFIALEYVGGGTLAQHLNKTPQPVRVCAQVVEALARAVHYAHQHGIVHLDLKPANVLLQISDFRLQIEKPDSNSEICNLQSAIPKVTDFGLAKRLEEESGQTQTGAVMGTPAYMAPEQASGQSKSAGPAVDIYALGVILYEMLTGRPPFSGDSTLEVLEQVKTREPERPTKLQPKIHRDLETICLKALGEKYFYIS